MSTNAGDTETFTSGGLRKDQYDTAHRERLIRKISSTLYASLDSGTVLQTIVNELGVALSVCRCAISLFPSPARDPVPISHDYASACCVTHKTAIREVPISGNPAIEGALRTGKPFVVGDVMADERVASQRDRYRATNVRSLMASSIRVNDKPIGFFGMHKCSPHVWADWEVQLVEAISEQAALAIRQSELFRETTEAATRANLVTHIVTSMRRSLDLKEILQSAAIELGNALGADRVYFRRRLGDIVRVEAQFTSRPSYAVEEEVVNPDTYFADYLARNHKTLVLDDLDHFFATNPEAHGMLSLAATPRAKSVLLCPLFINDKLWGGFVIAQVSRLRRWTAGEISLVEAVAAQIEIAIAHSELYNEVRQAATIESLIRHISQTVNQAATMAQVYQEVAGELGKYFNDATLVISRHDPATDIWHIESAYSSGASYQPAVRAYRHSDFAGLGATQHGGVLVSNDVENDAAVAPYLDRFLRPAGIKAYLILDLHYGEEARLSISAFSKSGARVWTPKDINILRAAGDQMLIAFKRAELFEEVLRGKFEWEATFDALADGLLIFDENGILRRVNQAGAAMEGQDIHGMVGRKCCSLMQGIEHESCKVMRVIESGEPVTFEIVPEKMARPVLITISPLGARKDEDEVPGDPARGAVCIVRDLSELRAAEAAAREQKNYLVKLVEHARDAICALSPTGGLIWCNEHFVTLTGHPRSDLMGLGYQKFIPEIERSAISNSFLKAMAGESQATEVHALKLGGEEILLMVTFIPIYDEGRVTGVLMISRDITEEKLASDREAQAEKMRMLGQIAAGVAHNFNNILAAVLGHAQLIKRGISDERVVRQAEIIERAALDGAEMVKRIQSFGNQQNDAGYEPVDVNQLIRDSVNLTRARWEGEAQARGIAYEVEADLTPMPIVYGSASEIREVFVNIILNSLDAMPRGGTLRVRTRTVKDMAMIHFEDQGVGMSEEVRKHIFEPFFTTKGAGGTGLGLAVSYSAIERHGGTIEVTSTPGRGSTFTVSLPAEEISQVISRQKALHLADQKSSLRLLIVDDDNRVREALVQMVRTLGYQVEGVDSGARALERLDQEKFDLLLTDLSMPGMDGWSVAAEARKKFPKMKIVMLTGYGKPVELSPANREVADEILSKPVRLDELSDKISQVLR